MSISDNPIFDPRHALAVHILELLLVTVIIVLTIVRMTDDVPFTRGQIMCLTMVSYPRFLPLTLHQVFSTMFNDVLTIPTGRQIYARNNIPATHKTRRLAPQVRKQLRQRHTQPHRDCDMASRDSLPVPRQLDGLRWRLLHDTMGYYRTSPRPVVCPLSVYNTEVSGC